MSYPVQSSSLLPLPCADSHERSFLGLVLPVLGNPIQHRSRTNHEHGFRPQSHAEAEPDRERDLDRPGSFLRRLRRLQPAIQSCHDPTQPESVDGQDSVCGWTHRRVFRGREGCVESPVRGLIISPTCN